MSETLELDDIQGLRRPRLRQPQRGALPAARDRRPRRRRRLARARWPARITPAGGRPDERARQRRLHRAAACQARAPTASRWQRSPSEFTSGMATPAPQPHARRRRRRRPERWPWGGPSTRPVDAAARCSTPRRDGARRRLTTPSATGFRERRPGASCERLDTTASPTASLRLPRRHLPAADRGPGAGPARRPNTIKAGEFVLGYPNEYGLYTDRPVVDARRRPARPAARDATARAARPRPQRQLPGLPPAGPGRARLLALPRRRPRARRRQRATRPPAPGWRRRWSAAGRAARRSSLAPDADDPHAGRRQRLRLPRRRPRRPALPDRRPHPPGQPARLARPAARAPSARSRSTSVTASCAGAARTGRRSPPSEALRAPAPATPRASAACTSSASTPTSPASSSSCSTPGSTTRSSTGSTTSADPLIGRRDRGRRDFTVPASPCARRSPACPRSSPCAAAPTSSCPACGRCATWPACPAE